MDHQGIRVQQLYAGGHAVLLVSAAPRHAEQAGRLLDYQKMCIGVDEVQWLTRIG
jgi:hypothetical protein